MNLSTTRLFLYHEISFSILMSIKSNALEHKHPAELYRMPNTFDAERAEWFIWKAIN